MFTKKTSLALAAFMIPLFAGSSLSTLAGDAVPTSQEMKKGTGMAQPSRKLRDASSWIKQPKEETSSEKSVREAKEARMKELDAIRAARKQAGEEIKPSSQSSTPLKSSEKADPSYGLKSSEKFPKMGHTQQALVNKMGEDSNETGGKASSPSVPHHDSNVTAPSSAPSHHAPKVEHEKIVTDLPMPHKAPTSPAHHADHADSSTSEHGLTPTEESPRMGNLQKQLIERMKQRRAASAQKAAPDVSSKAHSESHALPPLEITPEEESVHMGKTQRKLIDSMKAKKADDASPKAAHDAPSKAHSESHTLPPLEITPEEESIHMGRTERKLIDSMKAKKDVTVPSSAPSHHAPKAEHEEIVTDLTKGPNVPTPPSHHTPKVEHEEIVTNLTKGPNVPTPPSHHTPKVEHEETITLKSPLEVREEETVTLSMPPKVPSAPPPPPGPLVKPAHSHPAGGKSSLDQIRDGAAGLKKVDAPTEPPVLSPHEETMAKIKGGKFKLKPLEDLPATAPTVADQVKKGEFKLKKVDLSQPHSAQKAPQEKEAEQQPSDTALKPKLSFLDELKTKGKDIQEGKFELRKHQEEKAPEIDLDAAP